MARLSIGIWANAVGRLAVVLGLLSAAVSSAFGAGSVTITEHGRNVYFGWTQGSNPIRGTHFRLDFTGDDPDITLITGETWTIYAELTTTGNPLADINSISLDTSSASENYVVKIKRGSGPGAASVGTVNLNDTTNWNGHSSLLDSSISGSLTGNLTLVRPGSSAGELSLTIGGSVGNQTSTPVLTIPVVNTLHVGGNFKGHLRAAPGDPPTGTRLVDGPGGNTPLHIQGDVLPGAEITLGELTPPATDPSSTYTMILIDGDLGCSGCDDPEEPDVRAVLRLQHGLEAGERLLLKGLFNGVIDLNGQDVGGSSLEPAAWIKTVGPETGGPYYGQLVNVGEVRFASIWLGQGGMGSSPMDFFGQATVARVTPDGVFECWSRLSGTMRVIGDMERTIFFAGASGPNITASGLVEIGGNLTGELGAPDVDGRIKIYGDVGGASDRSTNLRLGLLEGRVEIHGALRNNTGGDGPEILVESMGQDAAITIDFDATGDLWEGGATIQVGEVTYEDNEAGWEHRVYAITECKADSNNSGGVNFDDIDGFVIALTGQAAYEVEYPGLQGAWLFKHDLNCDESVDFDDIDAFTARVIAGCCEAACGPCPEIFAGGPGGGLDPDDPADVAALYAAHLSPVLRPILLEQIATLLEQTPDELRAAFWTQVSERLSD